MKVLQIVKTNVGATWAFSQAKWLFDQGVDITTVIPVSVGGVADRYHQYGMPIIEADLSLPVKKPWKLFERARLIKDLVDKHQPDLIHCHFVTNIMMLRLALRNSNVPRLFQVPGPLHLESKLFRNAEILLSQENDYWAGACKKTCEIYRTSGVDNKRVFLAYYGNYSDRPEDQYSAPEGVLHREYGFDDGRILVGMISYFYKPKRYLLQKRGIKGHEDFIDAIAQVRKKHPEVIGVVIGDAWGNARSYVERVKRYAHDKCRDGVVFTGFRTDIKRIYRELDIAVHPSHSENLGGASESLAAGVPTISTDVGGFPDIVVDGQTGYVVPPKSPDKLANAILRMIENYEEARIMAEKGREKVTSMLNIENTGRAILRIYEEILNGALNT